ncbi:MAG: DUF302 domain-containing protein [Caldilineaceae bacterium]
MDENLTTKLAMSYEDAIPAVTAALKTQALASSPRSTSSPRSKAKIGADFRKYVILSACNPNLAHQALSYDLGMGFAAALQRHHLRRGRRQRRLHRRPAGDA